MTAVRDALVVPGRLAPYDSYQTVVADGVERIPSHWEVVQLRRVVTLRPSAAEIAHLPPETPVTFLPMEAISDDGTFDASITRSIAEVIGGYSYFRDGDVLRAKVTPCFENGKGAPMSGLANGMGFGTTELFVLRPGPRINGRFLYYLTIAAPFSRLGEATIYGAHGVKRVDDQFVRSFAFGLPPLPEQCAIAAFLDRETARIDELVSRKRVLLSMLEEWRRSREAETLLGGGPLPESGPGHQQVRPRDGWDLVPFRWLFTEVDDRSTTGEEVLLSVSQTRGVLPQTELGDRRQHAETLEGYKRCEAGDLVVNRMWVYYGALGVAPSSGIVSPDYAVFRRSRDGVNVEFMASVLRTEAYVAEMTRLVRGIGVAFQGQVRKPRLHPRELGTILMPLPPVAEAERIVAELHAIRESVSQLSNLERRFTAALQERRQALITAAVTGQIDVRDENAARSQHCLSLVQSL